MSRIRATDTAPERFVRSMLHRQGYRFTLHRNDLPGKPDIVLPKYNTVIFVHGCFWHGHRCAKGKRRPKTNTQYWEAKIVKNKQRDRKAVRELAQAGWKVIIVWECQLAHSDQLLDRLQKSLQMQIMK
jgi:DNA mismatch endonuclease, patch repair protein